MVEREASNEELCPGCNHRIQAGELRLCIMCRSLFCHRCAVEGYGRTFCSDRCREYFFHGDGEASEEDY